MKRLQRILAFILAIVLVVTLLPSNMTLEAAEANGDPSIIKDVDDPNNVLDVDDPNNVLDVDDPNNVLDVDDPNNVPDVDDPNIAPVADDPGTSVQGTVIDASNASTYLYLNRYKVNSGNIGQQSASRVSIKTDKPSLYGKHTGIYTVTTDADNDNTYIGSDRWPYVAVKVDVAADGEYEIATVVNGNGAAEYTTFGMIVDGLTHVLTFTKGQQSEAKTKVPLSAGPHIIVFTIPMPERLGSTITDAEKAYPWFDFYSFEFSEGMTVSKPTRDEVHASVQGATRLEAEDTKYVTWNNYDEAQTGKTYASGNTLVGGVASYAESKQDLLDLQTNGLVKDKMPYLQYMVEAPAAGYYNITIGAEFGTSRDENKSEGKPNIAVLVNGKKPVNAQFDGDWGKIDSVTVPVYLEKGVNSISCTSALAGQYTYNSAWVNFDYFELQEGLIAKTITVSAEDGDWDNYLYLNKYQDGGTNFGDPANNAYGDMRWDFPSLYEDMLGIYSVADDTKAGRWPYIAFSVDAAQSGYYQISANVSRDGRFENKSAKTVGMIVDGAMYIIEVPSTENTDVSKEIYLSKGQHVIIFTSPIFHDIESRPKAHAGREEYVYMNYNSFKLSDGLCFVKEINNINVDIVPAMTNYMRIEAEDVWNTRSYGNYNADISKDYVRNYNSPYTVKVKGANGAVIDGTVSDAEKNVNNEQSYIEYKVNAAADGTYVIRVGAYVEINGGNTASGTIEVNGKDYPVEFTVVNNKDGNYYGYDAVNLSVELKKGTNTIRCIGVTATDINGWIGYDFIDVPSGVTTSRQEVSASDGDWNSYLHLNRYTDKGANFGDPGQNTIYPDMKYDYPSLYEDMLGIYSATNTTKANRWPYIALKVYADKPGNYQIATKIGTNGDAKTIGMIVDGATYVVDVTTTSGYLMESVYLSKGEHVIIFTSPIPRDLTSRPTDQDNSYYPWMDFISFKLSAGLSFGGKPSDTEIQTAMTNYTRVEAEDIAYASTNGNYNADISKGYKTRYNGTYTVKVKGAKGATINGTVEGTETSVNSTQTYEEIVAGLDEAKTPYVQYTIKEKEAGTYVIRVGAYIESSGDLPYGTILVNGTPYKVQFTGGCGYEAVNIPVQLSAGKNIIQCIGVTADQACRGTAWIGYDFIDVPKGIIIERTKVSASDADHANYMYLNTYVQDGGKFVVRSSVIPNYDDMRYDFPSLYEEMLGIYSNLRPERAGYWPYIAFKVDAEEAGNYQIVANIGTANVTSTIGMIVDGTIHVIDVAPSDDLKVSSDEKGMSGKLTKSVYLTKGEHVIIFTSPMPRDMESRPASSGKSDKYPYMDFKSFELSTGLTFVEKPTDVEIQDVMTSYIRIEAEDFAYATRKGNYNTIISKIYKRRYGTSIVNDNVKIVGAAGAAIDGTVSDAEKMVNASQTSYVEYKITAETAGEYTIRVGAYLEGSGTMPYGTIMVNGQAYKAQFSGNWNGYDVVNLAVKLNAGENIIQCIGVTADQTDTNGWIGYDFIEIPSSFKYYEAGEYTDTSVENGLSFERRTTYETDGTISQEPYTLSAWIYLPAGYVLNGGIIFGNYIDGETPCTNFEIDANGVPSFYHINDKGQKVSLKFGMVDVCADEWTNITFTISGNNVSCYKNGVLAATLTSNDADINMEAVKNQYLLGGDLRPTTEEGSPNARYFKGRIIDVALYNKALSEEEVQNIYKTGTIETEPFTRYKLENAEADKNISDVKENNPLFVKIPYFTDKEAVTGYAYSFAVIGDTQIVNENDIKKGEDNLSKIYDWILANKEEKNIQFVFGLGDITDNNNMAEWAHAKEQISRLDESIPYSVIRGNHDLVGTYQAEDKTADYLTDYLGTDAYKNQFTEDAEEGGFYDANISNSWRTLTVGKVNYLLIALDFGPNDDVIEWANGIIEDHPNHQVIITTHAYLYRDGTTLDAGDTAPPSGYNKKDMEENEKYRDGDYLWDNLVSKHKNIVLVMCGHDPSDNIIVSRDKGENGNIVTSMLIDPQGVDSDTGSNGMLAMLYFSEDGNTIQVEYFSTVKDAYFKEINQFTIELDSKEVNASDEDWSDYLYLNLYEDKGTYFGVGNGSDGYTNYGHLRYDYPSLYENMLGIYSDAKSDRAGYWPYIAFTVNAEEAGEYRISAELTTNNKAETIGMIVDGAMHVVDVTTKKGEITESVYLTEGEHVIIFTSPMPSDMEGALEKNDAAYTWMDFDTFRIGGGLSFGEKPTDADIHTAMTEYTRIEAEDRAYTATNGNYNTDVAKTYTRRYGDYIVKVKGFTGAAIDGSVTDAEKKVNTPQTFEEISNGLMDSQKTSYVQYKVLADKAGSYMIRVGAYVEGSGNLPYGTILVNGKAYKAQFSDKWNGYNAVTLEVELKAGENFIQCIGITADQACKDTSWIGYDFIDVSRGIETEKKGVSASDQDWDKYLKLNMYLDNGDLFGVGNGSDGLSNYGHIRYDYPSLYEDMLGIYSDAKSDRAGYWPYIAFTVDAAKAGEYLIAAEISTTDKAESIGMIVDGAMYVVDVTTTNGELRENVYLTKGAHVIIFTSPMPRDMEGALEKNDAAYTWMDFKAFRIDADLSFGEKPTDKDIQAAMTEYTRLEAESISYVTINGNYNRDISKTYTRRYGDDKVMVKGNKGAVIDGTATAEEKKVNTPQTFAEISNGLMDTTQTSYVQYKVLTDKAGTYIIRVGAYLEGKGTMPYGTILVNGKAYKAQFSGKWNGYDVVNLPVELEEGRNIIQCIGITADQKDTNGWIGYDFIDISKGIGTEHKEVSASDKDWDKYLYLNRYKDNGTSFGGPDYNDMRWDYPALYEDMVGIYSDDNPDRANYWPYIAFTVDAPKAGEYQISAEISTNDSAKTVGMIVDGAMHVVDVTTTNGDLTQSVYLTEGEHVIIFTSPMPRDMESALEQNDAAYPWMDYSTFKLGIDLEFGDAPTEEDIKVAMTAYTRLEAEDIVYATYNANYGTDVTKKYSVRYNPLTTIMGASEAAIDGTVADAEKLANTTQTYDQLSQGLNATATSYVEYSVKAEESGTYMIRIGAYVEGDGTMPYGTVLINGTAYKVEFAENWNGYDAVNLPVELKKGTNTIQCIGVTADQTDANAWIGYDYLDIQKGLSAVETGATVINAGDENYVTFNYYTDKGDILGDAKYDDLRWDRLSLDVLNYAYLSRMPYAAVEVSVAADGTYDVYFTSEYKADAASQQMGVLVDGETTYTMTLSEFRSHVSVPLTKGTHTLVFTTPMPVDIEEAAKTEKMDKNAYPWMNMKTIILGKGLTVEKAPNKDKLENPNVTIEVEEYAMPNLAKINENGTGSALYLKAQTADQIVKNGIDATVTPYVEYQIDASRSGEYTIYVALKSGMVDAMTAEKQMCSIVIENGDERQVKNLYSHKDTQGVVRVIPVTLNLEKGINEVRITHFTGDSIRGKGYVWNDFDYIQMSPETAAKLTFLPTSVLEAEDATYSSYSEKMSETMSGEAYLGSADYGYIDENRITFEALDVNNLDDLPRVTYTFEAEKAGTYTISVKFNSGLINYKAEDLEKISFAVIVNGKDKQLVEYELATLDASTTRAIEVDLVEGENEITFTATLAEFMNAVSPRIESEYRLVWVDHDALYLSAGLSAGKEAEKFSIEDSSVEYPQLDLSATTGKNAGGLTGKQAAAVAVATVALGTAAIPVVGFLKRKKLIKPKKRK